jgi:hypothetical protein
MPYDYPKLIHKHPAISHKHFISFAVNVALLNKTVNNPGILDGKFVYVTICHEFGVMFS